MRCVGDEGDSLATIAQDFRQWIAGRPGISPLYEQIASGILQDSEMKALVAEALPISLICNRFMASVHYMLLQGTDHPLREFYETVVSNVREPSGSYRHFRNFCFSHASALMNLTRSSEVQINEVRRSAAFVFGLNCMQGAAKRGPLALIELGACAGFNLNLDLYRYDFGRAAVNGEGELRINCDVRNGYGPLSMSIPKVEVKLGIDLAPIDVKNESERNWLVAFASPDDRPRQHYLQQAIAVGLQHPVEVRRGGAGDLVGPALQGMPPNLNACVLHALTEHHFDHLERAKVREELLAASARRDIHVIGFEWPRRDGSVDMWSELHLTLTKYRHGRTMTKLLATSDRRGSVEWLSLVDEATTPTI